MVQPKTMIRREGRQYQVDAIETVTDDLDVGDNDFVAAGDYVARIPLGQPNARTTSTTSTSFTTDANYGQWRFQWDIHFPSAVQTAAALSMGINSATGSETATVRVRNSSDGENVLPATDEDSAFNITISPTNYTPTSTSSMILITIEFKTDTGNDSVTFSEYVLTLGVQV